MAVCCKVEFYDEILADLKANDGAISKSLRFKLSRATYAETSRYDGMIAT